MIEEIIELINKISDIQVITAHTTKKIPQKPFATYSPLLLNSKDYYGEDTKELAENEILKEKKKYREEATLQFDIYGNSELETIKKARELQQLILFKLRYQWGKLGVGIAGFSNIKVLNEIIQEEYEYRNSLDIKFEYLVDTERTVELARTVELIAKEFKKENEEEKDGNI